MWYWKVWFDFIWFDKIDIPNLTENNIHYGEDSFEFTADLQVTSTFLNSLFTVDAYGLEKYIRNLPKDYKW